MIRNLKSDLFLLGCVVLGVLALLMVGELFPEQPQLLGRPLTTLLGGLFASIGVAVFALRFVVRMIVNRR